MNILVDNKDLKTYYGIDVLDFTQLLSIAQEREDNQVWYDKSGVDKNLFHKKYEAKEFVLEVLVQAYNLAAAYSAIKKFTNYLYNKGCVVMSLRDDDELRLAFLVERSQAVVPDINIRNNGSLYHAKIGFRDVNPNALVYNQYLTTNSTVINYDKGLNANIYWGDGTVGEVSNSTTYTHTYLNAPPYNSGPIDIIVDVDKDASLVGGLQADFSGDTISGISDHTVQFTNKSQGNPVKFNWDFGDNSQASELENPTHTYTKSGVYSVTLTIYNNKNTPASITKTNYITVRAPRLLWDDSTSDILTQPGIAPIPHDYPGYIIVKY